MTLTAHDLGNILMHACRWLGRLLSIPVFLFLIAEVLDSHSGGRGPTPSEWFLIALFPGTMALGLLIGWKWELLGGSLAVAGLGAFYAACAALGRGMPKGPYFLVFTVPGILMLLAGLLAHAADRARP